jgi:hypothetical protein
MPGDDHAVRSLDGNDLDRNRRADTDAERGEKKQQDRFAHKNSAGDGAVRSSR